MMVCGVDERRCWGVCGCGLVLMGEGGGGFGCGWGFKGLGRKCRDVWKVGVRQRDASEMWRECVNCAVCGWVIFRAI